MNNCPDHVPTASKIAPAMPYSLRRQISFLIIILAAGIIFGRIMSVDNLPDRAIEEYRYGQIPRQLAEKEKKLRAQGVDTESLNRELRKTAENLIASARKSRPTLSANDRSRWLTIRALVEPECRVYRYIQLNSDQLKNENPHQYAPSEIQRNCSCSCSQQFQKNKKPNTIYLKKWVPYAIDKAMEDPGWDTIDMVKHGLKDEIYDPADPFSGYLYSSKPTLLPTVMAIPYWLLFHATGLSLKTHPFITVRLLLVLFNLIPLIFAWLLAFKMIDALGKTDWGKFFALIFFCLGTFLSSFAVTLNNHLPAVVSITFALYGFFQITHQNNRSWIWFAFTGFFGAFAVACELPALAIAFTLCAILIIRCLKKTALVAIPFGLIVAAAFFGTNYFAHGTFKPAYSQKRDHMALFQENKLTYNAKDWYIYNYFPAGKSRELHNARVSYWANRAGIDRGEPNQLVYLFHATLGHHGLFSLTPVWLLCFAGMFYALFSKQTVRKVRRYAWIALGLTMLFFIFYLTRDQGDRNYGGMTCGLRWFFPLIPLWIPFMLPVLDRMTLSKCGRGFALLLLFFSIMSVFYPIINPWSHPWLYQLLSDWEWIKPF